MFVKSTYQRKCQLNSKQMKQHRAINPFLALLAPKDGVGCSCWTPPFAAPVTIPQACAQTAWPRFRATRRLRPRAQPAAEPILWPPYWNNIHTPASHSRCLPSQVAMETKILALHAVFFTMMPVVMFPCAACLTRAAG